jgi:hypothetical protein
MEQHPPTNWELASPSLDNWVSTLVVLQHNKGVFNAVNTIRELARRVEVLTPAPVIADEYVIETVIGEDSPWGAHVDVPESGVGAEELDESPVDEAPAENDPKVSV